MSAAALGSANVKTHFSAHALVLLDGRPVARQSSLCLQFRQRRPGHTAGQQEQQYYTQKFHMHHLIF
jgi:hypothetical protein